MISPNDSGSPAPSAEILVIASTSLASACMKFVGAQMTEARQLELRKSIATQVRRDFGVVLSTAELDAVVKQFVDNYGA